MTTDKEAQTADSGLAKVVIPCPEDTFVANQSLILQMRICGKTSTFANRQNVRPLVFLLLQNAELSDTSTTPTLKNAYIC